MATTTTTDTPIARTLPARLAVAHGSPINWRMMMTTASKEHYRIIMVWQRKGDAKPRSCVWLRDGNISDVAKAQTYSCQDMADGDAAVYTFPTAIRLADAINTAETLYANRRA